MGVIESQDEELKLGYGNSKAAEKCGIPKADFFDIQITKPDSPYGVNLARLFEGILPAYKQLIKVFYFIFLKLFFRTYYRYYRIFYFIFHILYFIID